jgi:hypothetical protein
LSKQQRQGLYLCTYLFTGKDMTQDEIIEMTRQAGGFDATPKFLEAFAKLVAQHERKRMAWTQDHWTEYEHNIASAEREACAKMFDEAIPLMPFAQNDQGGCLICGFTPKLAAEAIRARGQA